MLAFEVQFSPKPEAPQVPAKPGGGGASSGKRGLFVVAAGPQPSGELRGRLAAHAAWCAEVVPSPPPETPETAKARGAKRLTRHPRMRLAGERPSLSDLLERVFRVDGFACPGCGGPLTLRCVVVNPRATRRILDGLRRATGPPGLDAAGYAREYRTDGQRGSLPDSGAPMTLLLLSLANQALALDGYKDAKWGMTPEQVQKLVRDLKACEMGKAPESKPGLCGTIDILGHKGDLAYSFTGGKLDGVGIRLDGDLDYYAQVETLMTEKYGKPVQKRSLSQFSGSVEDSWTGEGVTLKYIRIGEVSPTAMQWVVVNYSGAAASQGAAAKDSL